LKNFFFCILGNRKLLMWSFPIFRVTLPCNQNPSVIYLDNNTSERIRVEEGLKLKENILQTYRKQIDARRALLEIDTGLMNVIHECTRNEAIVEQ
jgi:hypothetical protein